MRSLAFSLSVSLLVLAACPPPSSMDTESDSSSSSSSTDPSSTGITTSTVTSTTTATHSTTQTTTSDSSTTDSSTTTDGDACDYNLMCEGDEDQLSCLHDCGTCNSDSTCDNATETPYSCPDDCDASSCDNDGIVDALSEQCDDGNQNDDDSCTNACAFNVCGDGHLFLDGGEECDDGNVVSGDGCSATCVTERRTVFVTSAEYKGNLGGTMGGLSGLDLADSLCQKLAASAGRSGTYMAWLSDANESPSSRFGLDDAFGGIFELTDGTTVASGWTDLTDGSISHAIDMDENGNVVDSSAVWSNTKVNGAAKGSNHCSGWTSNALEVDGAYGGTSSASMGWTDSGKTTTCSSSARLYCFQVG